ncbi:Lipase domain containing protein [Aphelenchoides fujianensis]|nr:Lipase domain containing protein [Aphelenchoides fujianensis]
MERPAVLFIAFCSLLLVIEATISPSFYSFIEQNYDKQTADLIARTDHGSAGSFGGGQHIAGSKTKNKPVLFIHGYLDRASTMWPVAQQFIKKHGYSEQELTGVGHKDVFQSTADIQHQLVTQAEEE